jgi:CubicO group peptidase (beta-lactamase class C family)
MCRSPLFLTVSLALTLVPASAHAQAPAGFEVAWNDIVHEWDRSVTEGGIVGSSLAFVHDGRVLRHETRGLADLESRRPVDERTIYHWASITKTFTAIAVLQLRDRGLLSLDDPVVEHVPELREVHNPFGSMADITLRHLLSHSAGFRGPTWPWGGSEPWHPHEPTEWDQLVAMIPYTRVRFEPGSRFSYSNPGIVFLGRVIEKVTGDVFEAYVDKNIFRPLGMHRAYFDTTPWHLLPHRSNHYTVRDGVPEAGGLDFNTGITVSNGGLNAPLGDMARYLAFLMGAPAGGDTGPSVLAPASLEEMWRAVVPIGASDMGEESMGLSFFLYRGDGFRIIGHTGTQRAFYSFFYVDPEARVGVIAAFNTGGAAGGPPDTDALRRRLRARVVNEVFPLFRGNGS